VGTYWLVARKSGLIVRRKQAGVYGDVAEVDRV